MRPEKAKLLKKLHAVAREEWDITDPHPILHSLAESEFEVASMSHLSETEIEMLIKKIQETKVNWEEFQLYGIDKENEMSKKQIATVKKLQKELGWSDEYIIRVCVNVFGCFDYRRMTKQDAFLFIRYLIKRRHERAKK